MTGTRYVYLFWTIWVFDLLSNVFQELITTLYIGFLCLIFASYLVYLFEFNAGSSSQSSSSTSANFLVLDSSKSESSNRPPDPGVWSTLFPPNGLSRRSAEKGRHFQFWRLPFFCIVWNLFWGKSSTIIILLNKKKLDWPLTIIVFSNDPLLSFRWKRFFFAFSFCFCFSKKCQMVTKKVPLDHRKQEKETETGEVAHVLRLLVGGLISPLLLGEEEEKRRERVHSGTTPMLCGGELWVLFIYSFFL